MHIPEAKSCYSMDNGQQLSGPTLLDRWQTQTYHIGAVFVVAIHRSKLDIAVPQWQIVAVWELKKGVWDIVLSCMHVKHYRSYVFHNFSWSTSQLSCLLPPCCIKWLMTIAAQYDIYRHIQVTAGHVELCLAPLHGLDKPVIWLLSTYKVSSFEQQQ